MWVYVGLRAYFVPITIDEAATFFHYIHPGAIWPGEGTILDANNHILNSFLSRCSYLLFGTSEFVLRLHAVLLTGVYLFYTFLLAKYIQHKIVRWAFILAFLFPHFFVEFFAFTRGYGISMALLIAALYHLISFYRESRTSHLVVTMVWLALATLANLTLFISFLIVLILLVAKCIYLLVRKKSAWINLVICLVLAAAPSWWFVFYGLKLKGNGSLYYGNQDSFWGTTVGTLMDNFTWENNLIGKVVLALFFAGLVLMLISKIKALKLSNLFTPGVLFSALLLGNIAANLLMKWLMDTNYLEDRTGLFYYPFFVLSLCFVADETDLTFKKYIANGLLVVMCFFPIHFFVNMNLTHSTLWYFDAGIRVFYEAIKEDAGIQKPPPMISAYHLRALTFSFYNFKDGGLFNQLANIENTGGEVDYQIVTKEQCNDCELFEELIYEPISKQYLMKRKKLMQRQQVHTFEDIPSDGIISDEFQEFERIIIDTLVGKILELEFMLTVKSNGPFAAWLIVDVLDEEENSLNNNLVGMSWLKREYNGEENNFHYTVPLSRIPEHAKGVKCFVWNLQQREYEIVKGEIRVNKLVE